MKGFFLIAIGAVIGYAAAQQSTACFNVATGVYVPNHRSCGAYFYCGPNFVAINGDCPDRHQFNATHQTCDPTPVDCTACSPWGGVQNLADPDDCGKHFNCNQRARTHVSCPGNNTIFDPSSASCILGNRTACQNICAPYIGQGVVVIGDIRECEVFHTCVNGTKYSDRCSAGQRWNPATKVCDLAQNVPICWGQQPTTVPPPTTLPPPTTQPLPPVTSQIPITDPIIFPPTPSPPPQSTTPPSGGGIIPIGTNVLSDFWNNLFNNNSEENDE